MVVATNGTGPWSSANSRTIEAEVPADLDVHLIATIRHPQDGAIRNWFAKRPRFHMHFTPTSALRWLNLVERWFGSPKSSCAAACIRA